MTNHDTRARRQPARPRGPRPLAALSTLGGALLLGACATAPDETALSTGADAPRTQPPVVAAALPDSSPSPDGSPTLYDELGGAIGVAALSEALIREIAADERIRGHYRDTDIGRFHAMMQEQMCERTGGGCVYTGDDMRRTHAGMDIHPGEFNAIVEALMRAMDKRGLSVATQNKLLALYAPMRDEIIDR